MSKLQFFVNSYGDRYLHEVNRGAFNRLGASAVFAQQFGRRLGAKDRLYIVVGTDSGALLRHVQHQGVPEGSRFLFLELDELLPLIEAELAGDELDENIHLRGQGGLNDSLPDIRFSDYANIGAIELIESVGAVDAYYEGYRQATAVIRQQLDATLWAYNSQLSNPSFIRCQLHNLLEEHVPAEILRNSFSGATAVLLGGGPSLDDILPWVREHQDDVVILAVSRICRRLREAGVTPHIVVSIDPTGLSFDISRELLEFDPRVVLAHANHVVSQLLGQWRGRSVYLDRRYLWKTRHETANVPTAGPTVTNTAFSLACAMGFRRVVFGGIDLCHNSEGYSHARGSNEHDAGPRLGGAAMRVDTNSGRSAETTPDFFNAINAFGAQILAARAQGVSVINPAPGAAVIRGVDFQPLAELALEPLGSEPFVVLHDRLPPDTAAMRTRNFSATQRELARANGRLRQVIALAEEALDCNDGLFGRKGRTADFRHKKGMDKIERQLDTRLKDMSTVVKSISARAFLHMPPSDREWTDEEIEQAGHTYYTAYRDNAQLLLTLVEQAQERLRAGLNEEDETPDFPKLFAQWTKDQVPGRGRVWLHRHPDLAGRLAPEIVQGFDGLERAFREIMQARDTTHAQKVRGEAALGPVRAKLQVLFRERDADELDRVLRQLQQQDGAEARQLELLGAGYLDELKDDLDAAFERYAGLIDRVRDDLGATDGDESNPRLEDALRRMVVIAMSKERHDQALMILETLASLSPAYEPQLAELLRLSGATEAAANVYTGYLTKAPDDHVAMLRLGKLYQSIGATDAAKTAFNYVLSEDPDNKTAQSLLEQMETAA